MGYGVLDLTSGKVVYWCNSKVDGSRWLQTTYPSLIDHERRRGHYAGGQTEPEHIIEHGCRIFSKSILSAMGVI